MPSSGPTSSSSSVDSKQAISQADTMQPSASPHSRTCPSAHRPTGQEVARYRKLHLSSVSVGEDNTSEGSILEAGEEFGWFDIDDDSDGSDGRGWRVGLANCFDLRFKELSDALSSLPPHGLGSELLLYPSSWLKSTGEMGHWETLLRARALDGQNYVMGVSTARDETQETVAFGRSCVIGPMGETVAMCKNDCADEVVAAELSLANLLDARRRIPLSTSRRPLVYQGALRSAQENPLAMRRPPLGWKRQQYT